jgi:hypothetical protein
VDPLRAFRNWHRWLKADGRIVVIDALWTRDSWSNDALVEHLPLACTQTRATLAYLLEQAGFGLKENRWLERVNRLLGAEERNPRYIMVAYKTS